MPSAAILLVIGFRLLPQSPSTFTNSPVSVSDGGMLCDPLPAILASYQTAKCWTLWASPLVFVHVLSGASSEPPGWAFSIAIYALPFTTAKRAKFLHSNTFRRILKFHACRARFNALPNTLHKMLNSVHIT